MPDPKARLTPEAAHLAEQERLLADLTEQLATHETEFATLGTEFARFRAHYLQRLVPLYAELDRLEAEIAHRVAASENTPQAHTRAAEASARAEESAEADTQAHESVADDDADQPSPAAPSPELRDLFRQAAKQIHPDLAADDAERARRTAIMAALNTAYAAGDADGIRRIIESESARPEAVIGDDVASRLIRVLRKLAQVRARFTELVHLTEALETDPLVVLFGDCRAAWEAGEDPLAADEASLRERIASAQARLAALVMAAAKRPSPRPPA
ncbi:MAG TPA: hypothetical protein VIM30_15460 [Candidatus Limnocylindrales bacterium]